MSNILSIETTLGACSVALSSGAMVQINERNQQTSQLPLMVQQVMAQDGVTFADITAYAVTTGPGSFTGVRIGLAFVRGLAIAQPKPIYSVTSLELLAASAAMQGVEGEIVSAINAFRGQLYMQRFNANQRQLTSIEDAKAIEAAQAPQGEFVLVGDAEAFFTPRRSLITKPSAADLAAYANTLPLPTLHHKPSPIYLRAPDAKAQNGDLTVAQ